MGTFVIKKSKKGYYFVLKAKNSEVIATSEIYTTQAGAKKGCDTVVKAVSFASCDDLTVESDLIFKNPKFEVYKDKKGEFRFRLKAGNGEIVAASEGYKTKASAMKGVESMRKNISGAEVVVEE
ncbi:MAG: DUF1508 domain-containing protein [Bacillota bacterium]|nr:DUF1508 domain-containing protein [Bacillota bacterium]